MKKIVSIFLAFTMLATCVFCFAGCAKKASSYDIVMITDGATITDGGYNESAWNGVKSFAEEQNKSCRYYQPQEEQDGSASADTLKNYVELAVRDGAEYIVLVGEDLAVAVNDVAPKYSDVNFVLAGAFPHSEYDSSPQKHSNVMTIDFDLLEAGYLAGVAAVSMGNTKLGYLGSVSDNASAMYGAGFVQGASYAADKNATPVILDYAEYDAPNLNYDYSFTIHPVYKKVSESKEKTYKVTVVDGIGSGVYTDGENVTIKANPAPEGKVFDHWECKSDTDGVKDKKVNISSKSKQTMNLLVGDCDCTITAVWRDATTYPVIIHKAYGEMSSFGEVVDTYYAEENSRVEIVAPSADSGRVFDSWSCAEGNVEEIVSDVHSPRANVNVTDKPVELIAIYNLSDVPTFDVTVENGTGSGAYRNGDYVELVADAPQDGYMFYKWENIDNQGLSTGVAMDNEFCYITSFSMVDRYASIAKAMYNNGTQVIFGGGNSQSDSIFTATWNYDYQVYALGAGIDQKGWGNCLASVVNDYGTAVKLALSDYKGGTNLTGNCENNCLYVTNIEEDNALYNDVYTAIQNGTITPASPSGDVRTVYNSKCLTLNYWLK